jgi:hypothetical protein
MPTCPAHLSCESLEDRCLLAGAVVATADWFSTNLKDPGLVSLVRNLDADKVLSRADMMTVFAQVEKAGTVSSTDFTDLQTLVNSAAALGMPDFVRVLSNKVVNGDPANATYQGAPLGNLTAGNSAGQLGELVKKWFVGADHPQATVGGTAFGYHWAGGTLFGAGGPVYQDVAQGYLGDCYFVSSLGETALRTPSAITSMFIDNGDNTWTVRFYRGGVADYVTVDRYLPSDHGGRFIFANLGGQAGSPTNRLWVALAEKAYVELNASGGLGHEALDSYQAIADGYIGVALANITGRATVIGQGLNFTAVVSAWTSGQLVGFASKNSGVASYVVPCHAYALVGYNAATKTFTVFNPWGVNYRGSTPGLLTLTWDQLLASFSYWDSTT